MLKEEVELVFPLIDVGETGQINRKTLTEWVVCPNFSFVLNCSYSCSFLIFRIFFYRKWLEELYRNCYDY